jgi:hypothetical protein
MLIDKRLRERVNQGLQVTVNLLTRHNVETYMAIILNCHRRRFGDSQSDHYAQHVSDA